MYTNEQIAEAFDNEYVFSLPDPEDESIDDFAFGQEVDNLWKTCERFDLQTEIWRGRALRAIRDREKKGGDGRGTGFLNWLKNHEMTKSQAYNLIQLANSADTLIADGKLSEDSINNFSKRAFVETAKAEPEVQLLISAAAQNGDRITRREVKALTDEWTATSSEVLPNEVKEKVSDGSLPSKYVAPLVKELQKLPESHIKEISKVIAESPDLDTIKLATKDAKNLAKYLEAGSQVVTIAGSGVDLEMALEEATRIDVIDTASSLIKQAAQVEQLATKFYTAWKKLSGLADKLYVDTGASTPNLRNLITAIEKLSSEKVEVPIDDNGNYIQLSLNLVGG